MDYDRDGHLDLFVATYVDFTIAGNKLCNDSVGARDYCEVTTVVRRGNPGYEILRIADEQQSDLIIMGVHGRGTADMLFFGSTTNHAVREARCPVLTIRRG